jgi:DisA bacterial checkpoint controller nucleotide-binding
MLAVKYFMWSYQAYFQVSAQVAAENIFQRLDPRFEPHLFLVGFQSRERPDRHPICVVPDDCVYQPEALRSVVALADQLERLNPESTNSLTSPRAAEKRREWFRYRALQSALQKVLDALSSHTDDVAFCSWPVLVEDYLVFALLQLNRSLYYSYFSLRNPYVPPGSSTPTRIQRSLLEAAASEFLRVASEQLGTPDPGAGFGILEDPRVVISKAGRGLMYTPAWAGQNLHGKHGLFDACNTISTLTYEGKEGLGQKLLLVRPDHPHLRTDLTLDAPVSLQDHRAVRKLLQLAGEHMGLLCDSARVYGLGQALPSYDPSAEDLFTVTFLRQFVWDLSHAGRPLMQVRYSVPNLPLPGIQDEKFKSDLSRLFGQLDRQDADILYQMAKNVSRQPHGAMLVIARSAVQEAQRLGNQCIRVKPFIPSQETLTQITDVDGAVLVDLTGRCHAIGVILDGLASERCSPARGARYNSAIRYVYSHPDSLVVVKSEDGMVNIFPDLKASIRRSDLLEALERLRHVVNKDEVEPWQMHEAMAWFERHRFYLLPHICEEVNRLWRQGNERLQQDAWRLQYPEFVPNNEMNESYFRDD